MGAIETFSLEKHYRVGFWHNRLKHALKPLTLTVEQGEVFGYLGPNGAGKTTTLRLLMGLVFPSAGSARILGRPLDDPWMKSQIGFLPEQPYFYDYLTPKELLGYYAALSGVPARDRGRRIDSVLSRVGLADAVNVQLRKFSKGMLQRVGIAQAIVHDPRLLFLDEPMSGLDPIGRREVRDLIQELNAEGKTIFFSTHILSDAETLCHRVAVLNKGELRGVGVVADLARQVSGQVEITYEGTAALHSLADNAHVSGNIARVVVADRELDRSLDLIRTSGARLISVTPVQASLEDYFLQKLEAHSASEVAR
ncbi:MAG TPA: ABC transporter ATP-binding protein [Clostridia bacterium]|nr:ABC transporter ATP-binding protein [Clostridia bacterium]